MDDSLTALKTAFELRLIDHLLDHPPRSLDELAQALKLDRRGLGFLLELLAGYQIADLFDGRFRPGRR